MLSSVLRRARCHLRSGRFGGRSAKERLPVAIRPVQRPWGIDRHTARPVAQLQGARFSTQGGTRSRPPKHNLFINTARALPDIYASPVSLLEERFPEIVPLDCTSASILTNGENQQWYTATYIDTSNNEEFHSGTLGGFLERMGAMSQWDAPAFYLEETCVFEGRVHYRSEHAAKQAAAARALDCKAFGVNYLRIDPGDSTLEPLRYCQEHPYLSPVFGEAAPAFYWSCLMQSKYGPIDANVFDVRGMPDNGAGGAWFTATCIEPKTGETFSAGVFGLDCRFRHTSIPEAPKTPLAFEEMRTFSGEAYYRDEATAKHAAAARAIDCMNYRAVSYGGGDSVRKAKRICIEEPYLAPAEDGNRTPADYAEMEEMIAKRRRGVPNFSFSEFMSSRQQDGKSPKTLLESGLEEQYGVKAFQIFFLDVSIKDGKRFVSATFIHPVSKEEFRSGILRPDAHLFANLQTFRVDIHAAADGSVWYKGRSNYAIEAAAARALDCYAMRDKRPGEMHMQFCYEDPYKEGEAPIVDHASLLAKRNKDLASSSPAFTSFTNSKPYLLHAPKSLLSSAFARANGVELTRQAFDVKELRSGGRWFTATFTDPITQETFSAGIVGKEVDAERREDACARPPLYQAKTTVKDGKVYYKDKRLAQNAAAARAIDCYIFREGGCEKSEMQLCMEDPYQSADEGALQAIDYDALLDEKRLLANEGTAVAAPIPRMPTSPFTSFANAKPYLLHVPKLFLHNAFVKAHGARLAGQAIDVQELQRDDEDSWFTANFTDPITKETFSAGLVGKEANAEKHKGASLYPPLHQAEATVIDGKVYYGEARFAEHAAAARAIDCYIFREGGGEKSDLQLCVEEPYTTSDEGVMQTIDYNALLVQRNEHPASENHSVITSDGADAGSAMEPTVHEIPVLELSFGDNPTTTASPLSTMGRIAEIWIDAATPEPFTEHRNADQSLKGILNWYDELDKEPRGEVDARGLAQLCNKILAALGKAVIAQDLEEAANHVDVEGDAKVILDHILSLSSTFDDTNDPSFFDADTFNAYIQCLNPLDPARSAKAATDLLNSMSNQEKFEDGVVLPLPNVGTYTSAMALWALVDGAEGQKGVNDVFSLLESASQGIGDDKSIFPNKETFNLLLAVNSKVDGRFSFEQAKLWLGKIQGISESILGEAFVPDADIYTAALTTFSKSIDANATTEQYGNTWLRHGHPYANGFKAIDDCASEHAEATDIAEWLIYAEQNGVTPSIDMYEAVIRAWVKTGALREGLLTAETWATRAVQSGSSIRLKTFHPIIAAWAMCQLDRAPDRVAEWTKQLASHTALEPDLTTLSAQIIAWRNVQSGLMEKSEVNKEQWSEDYEMQQDIERAFALAQNCTQYLKEVFADGSVEMKGQQDADALSSMFANAIETWGSASRFTLRHSSNSVLLNARHGVNELLKIARLFDATIDNDESEEKAQRLLRVMGDSVSEVLSQLHQIDSAVDDKESDRQRCYFLDRIGPVEEMMRNYEFYSQKHYSPSAHLTSESKATRHRMYGEALKGCAGVKSPADFGHVARICRMIMDNLAWQNEHCPGGGKADADITDLYVEMARLMQRIVHVPEERMYALTKLHKNARPFFEKKRKSEGSSYATVDRARLIGAMRMAMDDAALTEEFIQRFDGGPKTNARGNTALAVVDEMLRSE